MAADRLIVYCTFPDAGKAAEIAGKLVEEKLAACANLIPTVRSIYEWEGKICDDAECLAVIKTTSSRYPDLERRVLELHPYDCPEVIATPIERGHRAYLDWLADVAGG